MFGGGFGVGVAVTRVQPAPEPAGALPVGVVERPSRLAEVLPPARRSDAEIAGDLQRMVRIEAALAAYRAELVAELASRRPAALDNPARYAADAPEPESDGPGEFFCDELALILNWSRTAASVLHAQTRTLTQRLPATRAALADGRIDWPRARGLAAELGEPADGTDPRIIAEIEAALLPVAGGMSVRALREAARRELLARDAAAAERRRQQKEASADVTVRPVGDGRAELVSGQAAPTAAAMRETIDRLAWMRKKDGDLRPIGVIRAEVHEDLVLRPWDTTRPPVTAHLSIVAPLPALGGSITGPGEPTPTGAVAGEPITAEHLRQLLAELDFLGLQSPPGCGCDVALTDATGRLLGTATLHELRSLARRGCPEHPAGDGDQPSCACTVLGVPLETDRYRPTPAQHRFVTTRDRTCRYPGCRNKAGWADLDHVVPHAVGGPTACQNLCCCCRRHHRLKTHARKWHFVMQPDGVLEVTTPSGVTRTTRPPGLDPPDQPAASPPADPADDPPPF